MSEKLKSSAQRVQEALQGHGLNCEVLQMQNTTRSAEDAALAVRTLPVSSSRQGRRCQHDEGHGQD